MKLKVIQLSNFSERGKLINILVKRQHPKRSLIGWKNTQSQLLPLLLIYMN